MNSIKQFFTVTALLMILNGSASALDVKVENLTQAKVVLAFSYLDEVDNALRYYFWAKAEHEILVSGLFGKNQAKIDVYGQVKMNWEAFGKYLLSNR